MARSDNWRINKSGVMAVEGAQALKALQKVAGAAGLPKDFKVRFATKAHTSGIDFDEKEVVIGAGRLFQEAPIPPDLFDVLVGLTLHEVGHQQIGTGHVWTQLDYPTKYWPQQERDIFQKFVNVGEDIAIESRTRANPNLAEYDEALHKWAVTKLRDAQPNKLLEVWIEYALGHKSTTVMDLPEELVEPMQQLVALTGWLRKRADYSGGYADRAKAYLDYWTIVKNAILEPPKPPEPEPQQNNQDDEMGQQAKAGTDGNGEQNGEKSPTPEPPSSSGAEDKPSGEPEQSNNAAGNTGEDASASEPDDGSNQTGSDSGEGEEAAKELERPLTPTPEDEIDSDLANDILDAIESDLEDITEEVAEELSQQQNGRQQRTYTVIRSRETKTPLIRPDSLLRKKLERVMTIRKRLQARTMHGEQYGRIDKRHLHRIGTDERIFSLRYKFPDGFPNTRILIDLSGSMSGREAAEVLEAAGALQTLVNAEVWCYNHINGTVNLVRMDEGRLIHTFEPDGQTPSGLAIIGVSLGMKKDGLIVHLTDGEHNAGQTPWTANWALKKRGINLVNLIWGGHTRHYDLDGINYRQLNGLAEFPEALYQILVEQVKLIRIGGK